MSTPCKDCSSGSQYNLIIQMAGNPVVLFLLPQHRRDDAAVGARLRAAWMQAASDRWAKRTWHFTLQRDALTSRLDCAIRYRCRGEQRLGIGVHWGGIQR